MSIRRPRFEEEEAAQTINISPLIDVIFILLIFFIVTMVFADGSAMNVNVPEAKNSQQPDSAAPTVVISAAGAIYLDGVPQSIHALSSALRKKMASNSSLIVRSDSSVPVSRLVEVMDCAKEAGARDIYVAADKKM